MQVVESLLRACLEVNNEARRLAEDALKARSAQPEIVPELLMCLQQCPDSQIRHLSAVLLRKRIIRHWKHITAEGRRQTQAVLLERIASEPMHIVRRAVSDVASSVAKVSVPAGEWPELLSYLQLCGISENAGHREVALTLFTSLAENIGDLLQGGLYVMMPLVGRGLTDGSEEDWSQSGRDLSDASEEVRVGRGLTDASEEVRVGRGLTDGSEEVRMGRGLTDASEEVRVGRGLTDASEEVRVVRDLIYASEEVRVGRNLTDASEEVQEAALSAMVPLSQLVVSESDITMFQELTQALIQAATKSLEEQKEQIAIKSFQVLVEVIESPAPLMQPQVPSVITLSMTAALKHSLEPETREQALQVLHWLARYKPKQLSRNKGVLQDAVVALCGMCCEAPASEEELEGGMSSSGPSTAASQALDTLACHCSGQSVHPLVISFVRQHVTSPEPNTRRGALNALAVIAEGCAEALRKKCKSLLPLVLSGLADLDVRVRGAAAFALGQFSEHLQPEFMSHYETVLPALFTVMKDAPQSLQERVCYAIDAFCESLDKEILPFMPQLVETLMSVLRSSCSHSMQDMALSALASTIAAAGPHITPYAPALLPVLQIFLTLSLPDQLPCRCRATECAGLVFEGLGGKTRDGQDTYPASQEEKAAAQQLLKYASPSFMQLALSGFELSSQSVAGQGNVNVSYELREYSHIMFGCVAQALGQDFGPYLQYVVPLALQSCSMDDGVFEKEGEEGEIGGTGVKGTGPLGDFTDDEGDDETGAGGRSFNVRTGVMDEKCSSTAALGTYAEACPQLFVPYFQPAFSAVTAMASYFHEEVRAAAYESLGQMIVSAHTLWPPSALQHSPVTTQLPGCPAGVILLSAEVQAVLRTGLPKLMEGMEDDDKHAAAMALQATTVILQRLGPASVASCMAKICSCTALVLAGKAASQEHDQDQDSDGEDDGDGYGSVELEEELLAAACDLLPTLAGGMGLDAYAAVFEAEHLPHLLTRMRPRQPRDLRAVAVGAVGEVAELLQARMAKHLDALMPPLLREIRCDDAVNRQNAAFSAGVLVEGCGSAVPITVLQQLLQALHPLFSDEEEDGARDNATGAVARMLIVAGVNLPLEQVR
ncbi:hypothetical protein CEUSTIGMA_g9871.t1 [Chlamydomonas eustigma]|uniref:Importin N-terminal domain-containing protein n=1 Tax=Chlamydomonas eustigma TaxID=1157962 RepID=A0A250XHC0_9CHLO|nr:hypothetical protein CEUSTIGMA_g9871.t1 [Chlamydomonas eustigma]|eukprot:GAX82443.1 hypothetical protein CEUSTIGMA_g9871.t1 [Chlamydomonas eustigma]